MYNSIGYFDIRPPLSYTKSQLRNMVVSLWHTNWVTTKTCSLTKKLYPTYNASKARELSRKYSRRLIEIISGQNNLHYVQNKINHTSNLCRLSEEEEETFDNFVNGCSCLVRLQLQYFGQDRIINSDGWHISTMIKYSREPMIDNALKGNCDE